MSLFPQLVGNVEIRQRRQRYPGEPKYKQLSFVKTKKTSDTDVWDVIRPAVPRYVQGPPIYYDVPQYPQHSQLGQYQPQQQLAYPGYDPYHQPQQQFQQHQLPYYPAQGQYPALPPYGGHGVEYREPARIDQGPGPNEMIQLTGGHGGHYDDDDVIHVPEIRPRRVSTSNRGRGRSRSRSRGRLRGDSIYSSDDSSDDDYRGNRRHHRRTHRSSTRYNSDSDDDLVRYRQSLSRSRSRPRPLRGW